MEPEARARQNIDLLLEECGWLVQNRDEMNIYASKGVAVREFAMPGVGEANYLLSADGGAIGVVSELRGDPGFRNSGRPGVRLSLALVPLRDYEERWLGQ
jgi:hypothetical protein